MEDVNRFAVTVLGVLPAVAVWDTGWLEMAYIAMVRVDFRSENYSHDTNGVACKENKTSYILSVKKNSELIAGEQCSLVLYIQNH